MIKEGNHRRNTLEVTHKLCEPGTKRKKEKVPQPLPGDDPNIISLGPISSRFHHMPLAIRVRKSLIRGMHVYTHPVLA